jgi:hypothetical protein
MMLFLPSPLEGEGQGEGDGRAGHTHGAYSFT